MAVNDKKFPRGVEIVGSVIIENNQGEILLVKSAKSGSKHNPGKFYFV